MQHMAVTGRRFSVCIKKIGPIQIKDNIFEKSMTACYCRLEFSCVVWNSSLSKENEHESTILSLHVKYSIVKVHI